MRECLITAQPRHLSVTESIALPPHLLEGSAMPEYRAFEVGLDGHFAGSRGFVCDNDGDAIVWAKQFSGDLPIELWSGERLVKHVPTRHRNAISYEIADGRLMPKSHA